ncbi:MAG TPA: radical SAM protein, partial [Smithellaceae bacterium]|nr:radical SAM protein [Smithellaceae bacterium]
MTENSDRFACIHPPAGFAPSDLPLPMPRSKKWTICSLALDVSGQCNLRCTYCAESATLTKRKPMTEDVLDLALNYFFDHLAPGATPAIRFGSGEPLLASHILEQASVKSKKLSEKYSYAPPQFFLTTNGT